MTICISGERRDEKSAIGLISTPDNLEKQIIRAWRRSSICHHFRNEKKFKRAVKRNRKTLESPDLIKTLFTSSNYLFSTVTDNRQETLYFEDRAAKRTGRLRQQHKRGPLAKIDKNAKTHLFVSEERFCCLTEWHDDNRETLPTYSNYERRARDGKRHIEFAREGQKISGWHRSGGTIRMQKRKPNLDGLIVSALKGILGN